MAYVSRPLDAGDVADISSWRYHAPYDLYNETGEGMLDGAYRAVCDVEGTLIGFFCWGKDGHVKPAATLYEKEPEPLDFGMGLRPGLTGKGIGLSVGEYALSWLRQTFHPKAFRLAVRDWNLRARRVYTRLGFQIADRYEDFLIMTRDERPFWEASRALENGMEVYPADPVFDRKLFYRKEDCGWDMSILAMTAHCGTHVDAPAHIGLAGDAESLDLDLLNGMAQLLDWAHPHPDDVRSKRVLLKTYGRGISLSDAQMLMEAGSSLIGVDALSINEGETEMAVHKLLLENGVLILENAALEAFSPGWYEMRCLPLRMPGSDGAPVRLQLREEI